MNVAQFCQKLDAHLAALPADKRMEPAVSALCQAFRVTAEEVAILSLDPEKEVLSFLWPEKLQRSGLVPLSSRDSLAARTVRESKPFLNNRFAAVPHTAIFEQFRLDKGAEKPHPIQKILSVPLPGRGYIKGVVQVSRKGETPASAGGDFGNAELSALTEIAAVLARHL